MKEDISTIRKEYLKAALDESTVDADPFHQFEGWFKEIMDSGTEEPTAMILTTVNDSGQPYQRTVLLKTFDTKGFIFYTNYESRKSKHMAQNPKVSILFPWYIMERQVMVTGQVEKVSTAQSLKYFLSRPKGSQIGAWVSNQSQIITSRSILEMKLKELENKFKDGKVPLPDHWGGYRIVPDSFEFWQGRANRLHDRIMYKKAGNEWNISRLAP